jgi:hypothetical protein
VISNNTLYNHPPVTPRPRWRPSTSWPRAAGGSREI